MGETSKDWNKWAEDIYWSHFQTIHFTQFLLRGYNRQLAIPQKFVDNLKKKLPQSVILKGPSGLTWNVDLTTNDDTLFFNHGWQEFVQDHSLKETDLLVFRYDGGSQFDVLIFDGNNLCEKGASYFVRKREHTEHDTGCIKKKLREGSIDNVLTPSDDGVASPVNSISDGSDGVASPVNSISDDSDDNETVPSEQFIKSLTANKKTWQNARQCVGSKEPATTGKSIPSDDSDDSDDSSDDSDENETVPSERCIKSLTANKRTWQNARQCVGSKELATTGKSTPK
ncbi:B3 domain-containing protein REM16-like [Fagus crenata]